MRVYNKPPEPQPTLIVIEMTKDEAENLYLTLAHRRPQTLNSTSVSIKKLLWELLECDWRRNGS